MTKQMKEGASNTIELDKLKIDESISSNGKYEEDGIMIKKWEGGETAGEGDTTDKYLAEISKNGTKYMGTLNNKFQRDGYGMQYFENGDKYFGQFELDKREQDGVYFWNSTRSQDNYIQTECYFGHWKEHKKDRNGIYIWLDEPEGNTEYESANFDAYVGELEDEKYTRGTYLSKNVNEYTLYHGNFDKNCKKSDENAYFYYSKTNRIFHGKIDKDILISGYLASFDPDSEELSSILFCSFNEDGSIADITEEKDLKPEDVDAQKNLILGFRSVIFDGNYFGKIYSKYQKIRSKVDNIMSLSVLDKKEYLPDIKKILNKYNSKNIYKYIEDNFFGKEKLEN